MPQPIIKQADQFAYRLANPFTDHTSPWADAPSGGWTHPSGFEIHPSQDTAGHWQLWGPTVGFGKIPESMAKIKRPHPDPEALKQYALYSQGGPKPTLKAP